jgi:peptidoglycan hydrolase CwlO-like protein
MELLQATLFPTVHRPKQLMNRNNKLGFAIGTISKSRSSTPLQMSEEDKMRTSRTINRPQQAGSGRSIALATVLASTFAICSQSVTLADTGATTTSKGQTTTTEATTAADQSVNEKGVKHIGLSLQDEKPVPQSQKDRSINKSTAKAVNRIAGVHISAKDLEPPPEQGPITGFHPIKKALAPIIRLERNSVQLQQQIMKLEGPIAALNPPMLGLQSRMTSVEGKMGSMQQKLDGMSQAVGGVSKQMAGVRGDIKGMRQQITLLQEPIEALRTPIEKLQGPLVNVAEPLKQVHKELAEMKILIATVLGAIVLATIAISIGTPIAAIIIYRNRKRIFPNMSDHELMPKEKDADKEERRLSRVS